MFSYIPGLRSLPLIDAINLLFDSLHAVVYVPYHLVLKVGSSLKSGSEGCNFR